MIFKNQRLTGSLQGLQNASKETRDQLADEVYGLTRINQHKQTKKVIELILKKKLIKRQEEICKLREELKALEINTQSQLREKTSIVEQLSHELDAKNSKISKHLEQIDQYTLDALSFKARCEEQEKELEKFRSKLNEKELTANSQLNSISAQLNNKEEFLNKIYHEVGVNLHW